MTWNEEREHTMVTLASGEIVELSPFVLLETLTGSWRARLLVEDGRLVIVPDPVRPLDDDIVAIVECVEGDLVAILSDEDGGPVH